MIIGLGSEVPEGAISSADVERDLGLEAGWIERRTGIRRRRIARGDQATSDLAVAAGVRAIEDAGIAVTDLGLLLLATSTPDHLLPPTAPAVAHQLGMADAGAIDLAGACAGFVYALTLADAAARLHGSPVLVIAANVLSRRTNRQDPSTSALFGDGAGAVVVDASPTVFGSSLGADGRYADAINIPAGGSRTPITPEALVAGDHLMHVNHGSIMAREAIMGMVAVGEAAMEAAGITIEDVDLWVPHQAGRRVIADVQSRLGASDAQTVDVVADLGNSSAATIPIALDIARAEGRLHEGMTVLMTAVGAGVVRGGAVVRW